MFVCEGLLCTFYFRHYRNRPNCQPTSEARRSHFHRFGRIWIVQCQIRCHSRPHQRKSQHHPHIDGQLASMPLKLRSQPPFRATLLRLKKTRLQTRRNTMIPSLPLELLVHRQMDPHLELSILILQKDQLWCRETHRGKRMPWWQSAALNPTVHHREDALMMMMPLLAATNPSDPKRLHLPKRMPSMWTQCNRGQLVHHPRNRVHLRIISLVLHYCCKEYSIAANKRNWIDSKVNRNPPYQSLTFVATAVLQSLAPLWKVPKLPILRSEIAD